jgi:hypothetical protein
MRRHPYGLKGIDILLPPEHCLAFLCTGNISLVRGLDEGASHVNPWWVDLEGRSALCLVDLSTSPELLQKLDQAIANVLDGLPIGSIPASPLLGTSAAFAKLHADWDFGKTGHLTWLQSPLPYHWQDTLEALSNHDLLQIARDNIRYRLIFDTDHIGELKT